MAKQLTIISGKGGTGKTTVAAALASLANNEAVMGDCDVDAPDLHLILKPEILEERELFISKKVRRIEEKCTQCNLCGEQCRFGAITATTFDYFKCEGCGLCARICPEEALILEEVLTGNLFHSKTRFGSLVYTRMTIGEGNSGRLVDAVRQKVREVAEEEKMDLIIVDGSPGIGCPVIASITGVDLVLIVVEPTMSGIHDLERVLEVTKHFKVKATVCVNKYDLNLENTKLIEDFCNEQGIKIAGKIPFDKIVPESIIAAKTVFEMPTNAVAEAVEKIWDKIQQEIK